ncbi:SPOR domain-containing protein [Helicobacter baculiformis]|uniref:SPOR domain-containing protein n=1 Tax=Helicobacter baculiformis TaxID=427351 RepID=A0ABV7ZHH9_9HELI|nr:SPOR domain-containing protein [Helicobacter baculiformis]
MNKSEFNQEIDNSELKHDLNKKISEALNEHEAKSSGLKKILLIAAVGLIILGVVLVVFYKSTREPLKSASIPDDEHLQRVGNLHDSTPNQNNFENLTLESSNNTKKEEDRFDQIVRDIQAKQAQQVPEPSIMLPASPLDKSVSTASTPLSSKPKKEELKHNEKKSLEKHREHSARPKHEKHEREKHSRHEKEKHEKLAHKTLEKKPAPKVEPKKIVEKPKEAPKVAKAEPVKTPSKTPIKPQMEEIAIDHVKGEKMGGVKAEQPSIPKGFYLQVGVFSKTPNTKFMEAFVKYPHQIQELKGQKRYLIGPYPTREQADAKLKEVSQDVGKPVHIEIK